MSAEERDARRMMFRVWDTRMRPNRREALRPSCDTLLKIVQNVIDNPNDPKYRRVKARSNAFKALSKVSGDEFLFELGFRSRAIDMEEYFVATDVPMYRFEIAKEVLETAIKYMDAPEVRSPYDEERERE